MLTMKNMRKLFSKELTASMSMLNVLDTKRFTYQNTPLKKDIATMEKKESIAILCSLKRVFTKHLLYIVYLGQCY